MEKITFEIPIDSLDELINALDTSQKGLYWEQEMAKNNGNNELRDKLLTRFMTVQDLLSIFELEKQKIEDGEENS